MAARFRTRVGSCSSTRRYMPLRAKSLACRQGPERGSGEHRLRGRIEKPCSKNLDEARGSPDVGSDASSRFLHQKLARVAWLAGWQYPAVLVGTRRGNEEKERIAASRATPIRSEEKGEEPTWLCRLSSTGKMKRRQHQRLPLVA